MSEEPRHPARPGGRTGRRPWLLGAGATLLAPATAALGPGAPTPLPGPAWGAPLPALGVSGRHLVVVWLAGGADALALVAPRGSAALGRLRPRISAASPALVALDAAHGVHPGLEPLLPAFREGALAVLLGVGAPALPLDHGGARRRLERWLAAAARLHGHAPRRHRAAPTPGEAAGGLLPAGDPGSPAEALTARLAPLARAFHAGTLPAISQVELGGFDTHAAQVALLAPRVAALGAGLAAFRAALGPGGARVTTLVLSEQGRTLAENLLEGTDDGGAGLALVLGGGVRGGHVHGALDLEQRWRGGLRPTLDVRALLAAVVPRADELADDDPRASDDPRADDDPRASDDPRADTGDDARGEPTRGGAR